MNKFAIILDIPVNPAMYNHAGIAFDKDRKRLCLLDNFTGRGSWEPLYTSTELLNALTTLEKSINHNSKKQNFFQWLKMKLKK